MAARAGMTTDEFRQNISDWIATARHPTTGRFGTEMTCTPMRALLDSLQAHGFKTGIASGGDFEILAWATDRHRL
jgi:hypothetical protein